MTLRSLETPTASTLACSPFSSPYALIAIGASAGGLPALKELLGGLPRSFPIPILLALHIGPGRNSVLPQVLGYRLALEVRWAEAGERPAAGCVHVAPPDRHLVLRDDGAMDLTLGPKVLHSRPAADPLFRSVAAVHGPRAIGIVLSGYMSDGASGIAAIRAGGGIAMAQCETSALVFEMPCAAIDVGKADVVLPPLKLAQALTALADLPPETTLRA
jgi:two-component system, chemotaxis family, protein-glutamate methylesterase/glutaminase